MRNEDDSTIQIHTKIKSRRIVLPGISLRWASYSIFKAKIEIPLTCPNVSEDFGFLLTKFFPSQLHLGNT